MLLSKHNVLLQLYGGTHALVHSYRRNSVGKFVEHENMVDEPGDNLLDVVPPLTCSRLLGLVRAVVNPESTA